MAATTFRLKRKRVTPDAYLFTVFGLLNGDELANLESAIAEAVDAGGRKIVIDVSGVRATDADTLVRLLHTAESIEEVGGELLLAAKVPWGDGYVLAALERNALEHAKVVLPYSEHATAA
jgi:ABC-type transporter Mla MlaB component